MDRPESAIPTYMIDTNVFNWLVQEDLSIEDLPADGDFVSTPVQWAELQATRCQEKREKFSELVAEVHSAPFAFDVPGAGFDEGRWTDGKLANDIQSDLDREQKKPNNIQDSLIAETAIIRGFTLVTCDGPLREVAEAHGCQALFFPKRRNGEPQGGPDV